MTTPPEHVGSVAEEAARLLEALGFPPEPGAGPHGEAPEDASTRCASCGRSTVDSAPDDRPCRWCPVCQLVQVARTTRPETMERLADFVYAVARSLADLAAAQRAAPSEPTRRHPGPTVEDITVSDASEPEEPDEPDGSAGPAGPTNTADTADTVDGPGGDER